MKLRKGLFNNYYTILTYAMFYGYNLYIQAIRHTG